MFLGSCFDSFKFITSKASDVPVVFSFDLLQGFLYFL